MIHLDTGFLIRALLPGTPEDRHLRRWLSAGESVAMSAVAWTEFLCGPVEGEHIELAARVMEAPVGFTAADSVATARLFDLGGRRRGSLLDCMVAAVALGAGATLATTNAVDFRRFEPAGLAVLAP